MVRHVSLKATVHSKENSVIHVIQNLYHFLCSAEHKCIYFLKCYKEIQNLSFKIFTESVPEKKKSNRFRMTWACQGRFSLMWLAAEPTTKNHRYHIPCQTACLISGTRLVNLYSLNTEGWDKHQTNLMF